MSSDIFYALVMLGKKNAKVTEKDKGKERERERERVKTRGEDGEEMTEN